MGVDYDSVSGIGIEVTADVRAKFVAAGLFTEEEWEDGDERDCLAKLGLVTGTAGSCYDNEGFTYYLFVEGKTLGEIIANSAKFVAALKNWGVDVNPNDLEVIADMMVS